MIVIGSMISLGYYLPVIAAMWMREAPEDAPSPAEQAPDPSSAPGVGTPPRPGGAARCRRSPAAHPSSTSRSAQRALTQPEVVFVAVLAGAATLFFGIIPQPLFNLVQGAGTALGLL